MLIESVNDRVYKCTFDNGRVVYGSVGRGFKWKNLVGEINWVLGKMEGRTGGCVDSK